jgi:spectrin beta
MNKWCKEKLQQISVTNKENSILDHPDSAKRLYQAFIADFLANQNEFPQLDKLAESLVTKKSTFGSPGSTQLTSMEVNKRQYELNREWQKLLELKKYWDQSIKAIQCIDQFNTLCADVNDLLNEKLVALENSDIGEANNDIKSVRNLQSKQDKLERDLGPIETNINDLSKTADEVCKYFPQEKSNVKRKLDQIDALWSRLRHDVKIRKAKLDEKHGLERFENEAQDFHSQCLQLVEQMDDLARPRDLKECEEMQNKFVELEQEFNSDVLFKLNSLKQLSASQLAKKLAKSNVDKIYQNLDQANEQCGQIGLLIAEKKTYLADCQKYLKFKQDANNLELIMLDQEAYLQYDDLGSSLTNVEALLKRHDEFMTKLNAQDEKMKILSEQALKINHHEGTNSLLNDLIVKRKHLKQIAQNRKLNLNQSKEFFEFKIKCDDLNSWINERKRLIGSNAASNQSGMF